MANYKRQLYSDSSKTTGIFPFTKISCVSDDDGTSLTEYIQNLVLDFIYPVGSISQGNQYTIT